MSRRSRSRKLYASVLFLIAVSGIFLFSYQNCAKVKFSREIASEIESPSVALVSVDPDPQPPAVTVTTTSTTTTLPPIIGVTTTTSSSTTTTIPVVISKTKIYSATIASQLTLPQIDFKFVIDNSLSMQLNNTNVADAVDVMFNQSTDKDLKVFDVTGEVYTTTQNNVTQISGMAYATIDNMFNCGRDSCIMPPDQQTDSGAVDQTTLVNRLQSTGSVRPRADLAGDVLGFNELLNVDMTSFNGVSLPSVMRMRSRQFYPMPVSDLVSGKLVKTSTSRVGGSNDYTSFVSDVKRKINIVSPNNTFARLNSSGDFGDSSIRSQVKDYYINKEAGLCAMARVLKEQKKKLSQMSAAELAAYKKNTARNVMVLVSDEDDEMASGSQCFEAMYNRAGTAYSCDYVYSNVTLSYTKQTPNTCQASYPASFAVRIHKEGTDTIVNYKTFTITSQSVCDGTVTTNESGVQVCSTGWRSVQVRNLSNAEPIRASGDWTGARCTTGNFSINMSNYEPGSISCVTELNVNNGSRDDLFADQVQVRDVIASGVLSASELDQIFGSSPSTSFACNPRLLQMIVANGGGSPMSYPYYQTGKFDPSNYTWTNCRVTNERTQWGQAYVGSQWIFNVSNQTECDSKFFSACSDIGVDTKYCKGRMTAGVTNTETKPARFLKKGATPITGYSCSMMCDDFVNVTTDEQYWMCNNSSGKSILQWAKAFVGEGLHSDGVNYSNIQCASFADSSPSEFGGTKTDNYTVYSGSVPSCSVPGVLRVSGISYDLNNTFIQFLSGTVDSSDPAVAKPVVYDPQTSHSSSNAVAKTYPAKNLKDYVLDTVSDMVSTYGIKVPIIKVLTKMPTSNPVLLQSMLDKGQSVGTQYLNLVNDYQIKFGSQYASVTDLVESGTADQLKSYYGSTFQGLTESIRATVERALPIIPLDESGAPMQIRTADIASVQSLCIYKTNSSGVSVCEVVDPAYYSLRDLVYDGKTIAHIVVKSNAAIDLKDVGAKFNLQFTLK